MDESRIRFNLSLPGGAHLHVFEEIDSTNAYLIELGKQGAPEWSIAVAEKQTMGRGRLNRSWESPPGVGLWFSILLRPDMKPEYCNLINLLAAVSLSDFLAQKLITKAGKAISIDLKWPNDLLIEKKKLCGLLLQTNVVADKINFVVLGIGLNVNQWLTDFSSDIRDRAVSLKLVSGIEWNREELLAEFLNSFYDRYHIHLPYQHNHILELYWKKVKSKGDAITVYSGGEHISGIFSGLTPHGFMILQCKGEEKIISNGEMVD